MDLSWVEEAEDHLLGRRRYRKKVVGLKVRNTETALLIGPQMVQMKDGLESK
jgi:hypothetical protein